MSENKEQVHIKEESAAVEITEADYFDAAKREQAVQELLAQVHGAGEQGEQLVRPHIRVWRAVLNAIIPLIVAAGIFCVLFFTVPKHRLGISLGVSLGALGLYFLIRLRAFLIWCILVYQAVAPEHVRRRCVYTPSCSEYGVQALRKYGVLRGTVRIFKRLWRCHPPNGGEDPLD